MTALVARIQRDFLLLDGVDAQSFLQGQTTQDVSPLEVGQSTMAFVLQPHGKVDALVRITRTDENAYLLDCDAGYGEPTLARLKRFKLRTKVTIEPVEYSMVAVRGEASEVNAAVTSLPDPTVTAAAFWPGVSGVDLFFDGDVSAPESDAEAYEALRIICGIPSMGSELDEKTIPGEAGINGLTINFRKGCYTGQELVARIESRGSRYPRFLAGLVVEAEETPTAGMSIFAPGNPKPIGVVTSAAWSKELDAPVALAFLKRDTQVPGTATVDLNGEKAPVRLVRLPMSSEPS